MSNIPNDAAAGGDTSSPRVVTLRLIALLLLASLFRLWLVSVQPIRAVSPSPHDDALFLKLAESIIDGEWLGAYDQLTLAKGPMLSIVIALSYFFGVPFAIARQAIYTAACLSMAAAIRSAGGRMRFAAGVGLTLLANPISFDGSEMAQLLRQNLFTSFSLALIAATLALAWSRRLSRRGTFWWSVCWGLSAAGYYLSREETIWLAVPVVILLSGYVYAAPCRRARVVAIASGLALAAFIIGSVACLNLKYYGWFVTNELRSREFRAAYHALVSVRTGEPIRFVPVTSEARERIYEEAASFALLRPHLEDGPGRGWVFSSGEALPSVHGSGEIAGGWFMWALRDAVAGAGFYSDGRKASAFYDRLAAEVLEACRAGRLDCSEPVLPFVTGLNRETIRPIALSLLRSIRFMALYERFDPIVPPSTGNEFSQTKFRLLTGSRPAPLDGEGGQEGVRTSIMRIAGVAYRFLTPVLLVASLPAWMFVLARRRPWRSPSAELALAASALVAMVSSVAIVALIEATSFPAITIRYLHAGYPMLIVFLVSTCEALIGSCVSRE